MKHPPMPLRGSPLCCARGATPVAGQSPFHSVCWLGLLRGHLIVKGVTVSCCKIHSGCDPTSAR